MGFKRFSQQEYWSIVISVPIIAGLISDLRVLERRVDWRLINHLLLIDHLLKIIERERRLDFLVIIASTY